MPFLGRTVSATLFAAGLLAIALAFVSAEFGLGFLLKQEARSIGEPWARHIEARLPDLLSPDHSHDQTPGGQNLKHFPEPEELANAIADVLVAADVYQIDIINGDCYCSVALGSYENFVRGGDVTDVTYQEFDLENAAPHSYDAQVADPHPGLAAPQTGRLKHVFRRGKAKPHTPGHSTKANQYPLDLARLAVVRQTKVNALFLHDHANIYAPSVFAELYHNIYSDGELIFIIRLLINMEKYQEGNIQFLIASLVIGGIILIVSFSYPARLYFDALHARRSAANRAQYLAGHDALTELVNRRGFEERAPGILEAARAAGRPCGLILIDVNKFKDVNDNLGHQAGDTVLKCVASHLRSMAPPDGLVARLGGDEFALLAPDLKAIGGSRDPEADFPASFRAPIDQDDQELVVDLSAGMAVYPDDGQTVSDLLVHADLALYASKRSGQSFTTYHPSMGDEFRARSILFKEFRAGLEAGRIEPYYQPVVSLKTGRMVGLEALARWHHPVRGTLTAAAFHAVLQDHDICQAVGQTMLRQVTRDAGLWKKAGVPFSAVGINVEQADLMRPGFELEVAAQLGHNGLTWGDLVIELTENCLFEDDSSDILKKTHTLAERGCLIALDDFGTGYSSITHIKNLTCGAVKIDKSFITRVVDDEVDQAIVRSLIELGETAGFRIVAEGVETEAQRDLLATLGCQLAQGFLYSQAVPAADVPGLIERINDEMSVEAEVA